MQKRPIIFSSEMVKAILDDRKTQTRRIIKKELLEPIFDKTSGFLFSKYPKAETIKCPFGVVSDRLWVRETFGLWYKEGFIHEGEKSDPEMIYRATDDMPDKSECIEKFNWIPSIFMKKVHSRITLEITDVRVERVQDISDEDAVAEGLRTIPKFVRAGMVGEREINTFSWLWDSINKKRGYGWDKNPWVWVISFKKVFAD